jgi:hypothetical protein
MKKYNFLFLLLLPLLSLSQSESVKTVVFRLDTIQADSFYLLVKSFVPAGGRRDTLNDYILFRDTVSFRLYYENLAQQASGLTKKIDFLTAERDSIRARANRLAAFQTALTNFASDPDNRFAPFKIEATKPQPPPVAKPPDKKKKKKKQ